MLVYTSNINIEWRGEPITDPDTGDDIRHPRNIEKLWSKADLNHIGLAPLVKTPADPPEGQIVDTTSRVLIDGECHVQYTYKDIPPPTIEEIELDKERQFNSVPDKWKKLMFELYNMANNGPEVTMQEFKDYVKGL